MQRDCYDRRDDVRDLNDDANDLKQYIERFERQKTIHGKLQKATFNFKKDDAPNHANFHMINEFADLMKADIKATEQELSEDKKERREDRRVRRDDQRERNERRKRR